MVIMAVTAWPSAVNAQNVRATTITRLFWQDRETNRLSYADLVTTNAWGLQRGWVTDFPKIDGEIQNLGAMQQTGGLVLVGVQDNQNEADKGGWIAIDSGVFEEPHGNHFHWKYTQTPKSIYHRIDATQGSANSVTVQNSTFLVINSAGQFIRVRPNEVKQQQHQSAIRIYSPDSAFHSLAVVNGRIGYGVRAADATDPGTVDVLNLDQAPEKLVAYSIPVSDTPLTAVAVNSGKAFFSTSDGVAWVNVDTTLSGSAATETVNRIEESKTLADTTAFSAEALVSTAGYVLCSVGSGKGSALRLINASSPQPSVTSVAVPVAEGLQLTSPEVILSLGKRFAFLFQERIDANSDSQEHLTVVELDPNRDRSFSDARVTVTMPVGASKIDGEHGHHGICFDAYGRHAVITNPGDGVLTVLSLQNMRTVASFRVGGAPDHITAVGAPEHFH